jgi:nuclear polyadenylated RNA-binding protein NAB2
MPFGLTIGTERATALQNSIQDELTRREYSADAGKPFSSRAKRYVCTELHQIDPVMAEYITIMIINNKTASEYSLSIKAECSVNNRFA